MNERARARNINSGLWKLTRDEGRVARFCGRVTPAEAVALSTLGGLRLDAGCLAFAHNRMAAGLGRTLEVFGLLFEHRLDPHHLARIGGRTRHVQRTRIDHP